jgi:hypothetical protein
MPVTAPPAKNYSDPLVAVPTIYRNAPNDGNRMIPVEILWGTMGGPNNCVNINLQNNATLNFTQIVALAVDNSQCGADIQFIFPDTSETTTIPAYSPKTIIEVFTNATQFYVLAIGTILSTDISRFSIHNSLPPPIAVPTSQEQNTASANNLDITAAADLTLVASTVNGTLEALDVNVWLANSSNKQAIMQIKDGTGKVIWGGQVSSNGTDNTNFHLTDLNNLSVRFSHGLVLHISSSNLPAGSRAIVNLFYRIP